MIALPLLVGLGVGWLATVLARRIALATGFVAHPNPIVPDHRTAVAYMGGTGVVVGGAAGLLAAALAGGVAVPWAVVVGALGFVALGLVDDLVALTPRTKLGLQAVTATLALAAGELLGPSLVPAVTAVPVLDAALALLWVLVLVNAVNLVDVCDGLAGGIAATAAGLYAASGSPLAPVAAATCGGCLGFLLLNRPPARIYLGDAGSHLLGFLLAAFALTLPGVAGPEWLLVAGLHAVVPLFELIFLIVVRTRKGIPFWRGSPDHFALRLRAAGWSKAAVAGTAALLTAAGWFAGTLLGAAPVGGQLALAAAALLVALAAARWLQRHEVVPT